MALTAGQEISVVSARARDPQNTATSRDSVRDLLSRMQVLANGATESVIQSTTVQVDADKQVYSISGILPDALRIVDVRDASGRSLDGPIPYNSLRMLDFTWWRETGPELRSWCAVGKDVLILRPALTTAQNVTVYYTAVTSTLNSDVDSFQIPDEDIDLVLDPVEFLLDLKARDFDDCKPIFERWTRKIAATRGEVR